MNRAKVVANCTKAISKGGANRGIRLGARSLDHFRNIRLNFGKSYGYCEVIFEPGTRVVAQLSASIGEPMDSRPGEGVMTVSVWISPAATGEMIGSSQRPALIARTIERIFKENKAIDLESLCIRFAEKAWVLRADVHVIDMNGCLQEAAALAVLGGLLTFRRPNAYIHPDTDELVVERIQDCIPIKLHLFHLPVLTSFVLCNGTLMSEPVHEEEEIYPGKLIIGLNDSKELCYLHTTNVISEEVLLAASKIAQVKCVERANWVKELAAKYIEDREVPVYTKAPGPRTKGLVISLDDAERNLPSISKLEITRLRSSNLSNEADSEPQKNKLNSSKIRVLEEFAV